MDGGKTNNGQLTVHVVAPPPSRDAGEGGEWSNCLTAMR
jgi:hypothetical protein